MTLRPAAIVAVLAVPIAAMAEEQLAFVPPPGFVIMAQTGADGAFVREYRFPDDPGEPWRARQVHQRLPDWAGANPIEFLRLRAGELQADCPEIAFRVTNGRVPGGYPNAAIFGRCPSEPQEWFVSVAVSGDAALHVAEHVWQGTPAPEVFEQRLAAMMATPLCQAARAPGPCP
ncbi:MAG: hypothetical protein AAF689_12165 [Pseudomonadota bacterium]